VSFTERLIRFRNCRRPDCDPRFDFLLLLEVISRTSTTTAVTLATVWAIDAECSFSASTASMIDDDVVDETVVVYRKYMTYVKSDCHIMLENNGTVVS
jgi:hypothetical protein